MNKLLPMLRRDFPEFDAVKACEAGIPIYFIRLAVEVLEPQKLTSFQSYFLHAVALGVNTHEEIAHLLGVDDRDLLAPGASLLKLGYIEQSILGNRRERHITLTAKGRQALGPDSAPPVPKYKTYNIHFNALTWTPIPYEEKTWSIDQMCKDGLFILPMKEHVRPTLGDFTEQDVSFCLSFDPKFKDNSIVALLEVKKVEPEYIAPVTIFLLQHQKTGEQRLAVYRNGMQEQAEAAVLQRLFEDKKLVFPEDATAFKELSLDLPASLPPHLIQATQTLAQNEEILQEIEAQLIEKEERQGTTQNSQERQELEKRIQQLKEELQIKRKENELFSQQLRENQVEFLRTEDHRGVLELALREAQKEIIIISPWMNRRACDDTLCNLIGKAVARGVYIRIGYGIGKEHNTAEGERNRNNVYLVKSALNRFIQKGSAGSLEMRETSGTHQKILVCDRKFAVTGSFNWLSYVGERDEGYRNETGTLFRHSNQINELAQIALQAFSS